tara:strand:- start:39739 stop:40677 length:939 start_codon:yes stop_codon:yes gene_type:complete
MADHTTNYPTGNATHHSGEFIGVDWGSSSFRLMSFDSQGQIQHQTSSGEGVVKLGKHHLQGYLINQISKLDPAPILMCGMVGSRLGWQEVPYLDCPARVADFSRELVKLNADFEAYLVPGLRFNGARLDVMRGEEVQLCGWWHATDDRRVGDAVRLCLPGTHSKWVTLEGDQITSIETALTGELFQLVGQHSVLVQGEQRWQEQSFMQGVYAAQQGKGLLHNLFSGRANVVAGGDQSDAARSYLSGLLIGTEFREQQQDQEITGPIQLIGTEGLVGRYIAAANLLDIEVVSWSGEAMVAAGLRAIWREKNVQ